MRQSTHPGVFLKQTYMKSRNLTNQYLYKNSEVKPDCWRLFLKGQADINEDIAYELSDKLNVPVNFWFDMQKSHNKSRLEHG